ncbi:thioredoxin domain-containing protein [Limnoglobus roseus]|uniref:RedB protein n=1 Tax=Limnoglobus roseus TaxID=2598579 RepID=A0A5C1AUG8_9BACT|nr:RedB protein [Limnoglobus roseus]QEL20884.1 RedB protein [Limnoglobus roseus]
MPRSSYQQTILLIALWAAAIVAGFYGWARYDATPGKKLAPMHDHVPDGRAFTLVLYLHPHCPCAVASVAEFAEIVGRVKGGCRFRVAFVCPPGAAPGWERTKLWDRANALPGVEVNIDAGGEEAKRAGAATSGHAVLFDAAGTPRFSGGLTRSRGQRGAAAGREAILAALAGQEPPTDTADVFGCPLLDPSDCTNVTKCHSE